MENYVPYKKRLAEFLKEFPVKDGWKRVVDPIPPADLLPGFDDQYRRYLEACTEAGITPHKVVAFRARLISPTGDVAVQVHKVGLVETWQDVMTAETRAYDRILVHTGFGSDVDEAVDADVAKIEESLGMNPKAESDQAPKAETPAPKEKPKAASKTEAKAPAKVEVEAEAQADPQAEIDAAVAEAQAKATVHQQGIVAEKPVLEEQPSPTLSPKPAGSVPDIFLRQIQLIQKQRNLPMNVPQTIEDAREMLRGYLSG